MDPSEIDLSGDDVEEVVELMNRLGIKALRTNAISLELWSPPAAPSAILPVIAPTPMVEDPMLYGAVEEVKQRRPRPPRP